MNAPARALLATLCAILFANGQVCAQTPPTLAPTATASATAASSVSERYVRGQVLTIGRGFLVFTTGAALRLDAQTIVPKGVTTGSSVRVTLDPRSHEIINIEHSPRSVLTGETDASSLDRAYVVSSAASAPTSSETPVAAGASIDVRFSVSVPANTPLGNDVYVATDRSAFSPAETRMQQIDARHFTVTLALPTGTRLRYQYTRGSNASVERDRSGDIAPPRAFVVLPGAKIEDAVARWADLN